MGVIKNRVGEKFNMLLALEFSHLDRERGIAFWKYRCDCGKEVIKNGCWVGQGKVKSCGCVNKEIFSNNLKKNRKSTKKEGLWKDGKRHPAYTNWLGMKARCYCKTLREYRWYGARGIKVCQEWVNNASSFIAWADKNGYQKGLCIDRIDVNKDYTPENCQFITRIDNLRKIRNDNLDNNFSYSRNRIPKRNIL